MPKVSIITPLYNGEDAIADCLRSVQAQTFTDYEHIVIDNNSSDGGVKIVEEMARLDNRIKLLKNEASRGAGPTRNVGIHAARGRYIAFLDCDDAWKPEKLDTQVRMMTENNLALSWTEYDIISAKGEYIRTQKSSEKATYRSILHKKAVIGCLTAVYDTKLLGKCYMKDIPMRQDFCLWLDIIKHADAHGFGYRGLSQSLSVYRLGGMTKNKLKVAQYQWKVYRETINLTVMQTVAAFVSYGLHGFSNRFPTKKAK